METICPQSMKRKKDLACKTAVVKIYVISFDVSSRLFQYYVVCNGGREKIRERDKKGREVMLLAGPIYDNWYTSPLF